MDSHKKIWMALVAVAIIAIIGVFSPQVKSSFGQIIDTSYFDYFQATTNGGFKVGSNTVIDGSRLASFQGLTVGSSGTAFTRINGGKCYVKAYAATIAATTTATVDCQASVTPGASISALTGVTFGDAVVATMSTSTAGKTSQGALSIQACAASTTAGYLTCDLYNGTGATYTWSVATADATGTISYIAVK